MNLFKPLASVIKAFIFPLSTDIPPATSWHREHQPILLHQSRLGVEEEWKCALQTKPSVSWVPCSFYSALIPLLRRKNPPNPDGTWSQGGWQKFYGFSADDPRPWTLKPHQNIAGKLGAHRRTDGRQELRLVSVIEWDRGLSVFTRAMHFPGTYFKKAKSDANLPISEWPMHYGIITPIYQIIQYSAYGI